MGWRYRKSFKPLPGVRLTLSSTGLRTSVSLGPLRLTADSRLPEKDAGPTPGHSDSYEQREPSGLPSPPAQVPRPPSPSSSAHGALTDIRSASSETLTSAGLEELKAMLERANQERTEIARDHALACDQEDRTGADYRSWRDGWLFRRLFKQKYAQLRAAAEEATAYREELEEQKRLARLETTIEMPSGMDSAFRRVVDEFKLLAKSAYIWDTVGERSANKVAERTIAGRVIDRKRVKFSLGKCEMINCEWEVPKLMNANGGDIYLYPGFVIYYIDKRRFGLLEYGDMLFVCRSIQFQEEETVPPDSCTIGHTWTKVNKDGSPDKRFKDNRQIPLVRYGQMRLSSSTGLNEEYMFSNAEQVDTFARAFSDFAALLG